MAVTLVQEFSAVGSGVTVPSNIPANSRIVVMAAYDVVVIPFPVPSDGHNTYSRHVTFQNACIFSARATTALMGGTDVISVSGAILLWVQILSGVDPINPVFSTNGARGSYPGIGCHAGGMVCGISVDSYGTSYTPGISTNGTGWVPSSGFVTTTTSPFPPAQVYSAAIAYHQGFPSATLASADWLLTLDGVNILDDMRAVVAFNAGAPTNARVVIAHGADNRLLRAYADGSGPLKVDRFSDADPPGVAQTITVETTGVTACSLACLGGPEREGPPRWELLYCQSSAVKRRYSNDQGRSWSVATTIASGYDDVSHVADEGRGVAVAALYKTSSTTWFMAVGTLGSDGVTWTYSTPATLVTGANPGGCVIRRSDGAYEFAYNTSGGVQSIVRCKALSSAGAGSWS